MEEDTRPIISDENEERGENINTGTISDNPITAHGRFFLNHFLHVFFMGLYFIYKFGLLYLILVAWYKLIFKYSFFSTLYLLAAHPTYKFSMVPHALWGWLVVAAFAWAAFYIEIQRVKD